MMNTNPSPILGPWDHGFTLDVHTVSAEFLGYDLHGHPQFDTVRSEIGEKLYRLKYRGDRDASMALAAVAAEFVRDQRIPVDVVVPIPPSKMRSFQPLMDIASRLAKRLGVVY
ncbi:MAG: ComF family protein, partial [Gemmatimonadetes bacterium]|nr:ComF family protein [Gemmatimonadota bacterium]